MKGIIKYIRIAIYGCCRNHEDTTRMADVWGNISLDEKWRERERERGREVVFCSIT